MSEDHLSNETSVSAAITESGVNASAKSRTIAAIDRLVGNVADLPSAWIEGINVRKRAKTEGERQLIEAAAQYGIERMGQDHEFAERAYGNHFRKIAGQQLNKDAVVAEALEDLRRQPPKEADSVSGPNEISDEFMDRFERYAEGATTEQLRQRWGRILASEIRKPGTFSAKVLRATDELDAETARLFESFMPFAHADVILKPLAPELGFKPTIQMVNAGLIVEPGLGGHISYFSEAEDHAGEKFWYYQIGDIAVAFYKNAGISYGEAGAGVIALNDEKPAVPCYILTDVGRALRAILPNGERQLAIDYGKALQSALHTGDVSGWVVSGDRKMHRLPIHFRES